MWPFNTNVDQVSIDDLRSLIPAVREGRTLEYKSSMYERNDRDTREMLKDISALANASGGYLIIGMSEDQNAADGTPLELIGIIEGDESQRRIETQCRACIFPPIIGLRIRDIEIGSGKSVLVASVPNSGNKPHMVNYKGTRDYYIRYER